MGEYSDDLTDPFAHGAVKDKKFEYLAHLAEHLVYTEEVTGSNPVILILN